MPAYPKKPLEDKLAWMRERQKEKAEAARRKEGEALKQRREEQATAWEQHERLRETLAQPPAPPRQRPEENLPPEWRMLRVEKVARILGVSKKSVQRWFRTRAVIVREGPTQTKTMMLIPEKALDDWFREHAPKKVS